MLIATKSCLSSTFLWGGAQVLLASIACGQVSVEMLPCGVEVSAPSSVGAAQYRLSRDLAILNCPIALPPPGWLYRRTEVAVSRNPVFFIGSSPAFNGRWVVEALDASGGFVSIATSAENVAYPVSGLAPLSHDIRSRRVFVGECILLEAPEALGNSVGLQWLRNGVPIEGETTGSLAWTVDAADQSAVFSLAATNECGVAIGEQVALDVQPGPAGGGVRWLSLVERRTSRTLFPSCNASCGTIDTVTELRFGDIDCVTLGPASAELDCPALSSSGVIRSVDTTLRFGIPRSARLVMDGVNSRPYNIYYSLAGSIFAELVGPVSIALPNTFNPILGSEWGPIEVDLPAGEYELRYSAVGGPGCSYQGLPAFIGAANMRIRLQFDLCPEDPAKVLPGLCGCGREDLDADQDGMCDPPCVGDLNDDGVVSAGDLPALLNSWGVSGLNPADLDGDRFVGSADIAVLLAHWGPCP